MLQFLISAIAFIVAISVLVVVHEFGHFWVARRFGVKVLRFSVGFGRPLCRWYDKLGTEYVISSIPLGGYVSLFGEKSEGISSTDRHMAFDSKPVWVRMLVVLAGPFFNFAFAVLAYWLVFLLGISVFIPILGNVPADSPAGLAGFHRNQEIVSIEEKPTPSWETVSVELVRYIGEDKNITVTVRDRADNKTESKVLDLGHWASDSVESNWLEALGFVPMDPMPAIVGSLVPNYPAEGAGLKKGDRIVEINGKPILSRTDVVEAIQGHPAQQVTLEILRDKQKIKMTLEPLIKTLEEGTEAGKKVGFIGIEFEALKEMPKDMLRIQRFGFLGSFEKAVHKTVEYSVLTLQVLKKMVLGKMSVRHINGPLAIAEHAGRTAMSGFKRFVDFLGLISVSLGVLNLLPIPLLDGGHFAYCVYELLTGRRVPDVVQRIGLWMGGSLLVGFMMLAFYNDLVHLLR